MQIDQHPKVYSGFEQYLIYSNENQDKNTNPNPNQPTNSNFTSHFSIPNGYTSKIYKRPLKNKTDEKLQCNKLLLYAYKCGYDPCTTNYRNQIRFKKISNTTLHQDSGIFGLKTVTHTLFLKRISDFHTNLCGLLVEHNDYKDKTKGKLKSVIKCIRIDLRYPVTFTTINPIMHREQRKYKSFYTKRFTTKYITQFNKLLLHWLKYNFERYLVVYNTEFRQEYTHDTSLFTAKNPHHHMYIMFSSRYSLKKFFDTINTFWCTSLNIPLPPNKKTGYIYQCPPQKRQHWWPFKFPNANGLVLDDSKETFTINLHSIFMRASYLCKKIDDNKTVDLGKQFNIMTDETTQKYLKYYRNYILPVYY